MNWWRKAVDLPIWRGPSSWFRRMREPPSMQNRRSLSDLGSAEVGRFHPRFNGPASVLPGQASIGFAPPKAIAPDTLETRTHHLKDLLLGGSQRTGIGIVH